MTTTIERKTGAGLAAASGSASPRKDDKGVRRQYFEAAPNKMFSELTRACIRFVRYEEKVPCALCGKQSKKHWTCVVRFKAANLKTCMFEVKLSPNYFAAGTPVCDDLGADSLDEVELIMAFEDEFEIDVADEQAERCKTVGDVITLLKDIKS